MMKFANYDVATWAIRVVQIIYVLGCSRHNLRNDYNFKGTLR